ncbi:MAG: 4-(cytidine 5'-diphospho)-2-C-methyl-D-erythritol kinase [Rhodobacteraceae bacterium]|nr:4-(cytidine 5'-diphospho)-2-C-methyl-D-erythritol kinase [Paracoccaceae bacterium]
MTAEALAPAKINLTLHVTDRRDDGYHLLDSLVVFAGVGDRITASPADKVSLEVTGPMAAGVPTDGSNLVLRAAGLMPDCPARITLDKHLPAAAGIGGGSSDAAATIRALTHLGGTPPPDNSVLTLGADVPVCLANRPARMRGIGGDIGKVPALPPAHLVLVNPGIAVPTAQVFAALDGRSGKPMPETLPDWDDTDTLAQWLSGQRNDLETPACAIAPVINDVLTALSNQPDCLLARMSGSGATCFGLFATDTQAARAARDLGTAHPTWWVVDAPILGANHG